MDEIRSTISPEMKMQMEMSVAIANRIYDILEAKGLSQRDFARLMGKSENEVSRWLSGELLNPSQKHIGFMTFANLFSKNPLFIE